MSLTFKEKLDIAWKQGEFAHAWAKFIVQNQIDDFAKITEKPDFDIGVAWDDKVIEDHIEAQRKRPR